MISKNTIYRYLARGLCVSAVLFSPALVAQESSSRDYQKKDWKQAKQQEEMPSDSHFGLLNLDLLYFRATNEDLVYALDKRVNEKYGAFTNRILEGSMVRPNILWKPGFRLGLGLGNFCDSWNLNTSWTYYYNKSTTNKSAPNDILLTTQQEGFLPYWAVIIDQNRFTTSAGNSFMALRGVWQLNYNMLDLTASRPLQWIQSLTLTPYFGLQNGWINQKIVIEYTENRQDFIVIANVNDTLTQMSNKFWGIGVTAGTHSDWQIGAGFSITGKLSGSLLTGRTRARSIQSGAANVVGGTYRRQINDFNRYLDVVPGFMGAIGINWGTKLGYEHSYLGFGLTWETNYWWNQLRQTQISFTSGGDQGVTNAYRGGNEQYPPMNTGLHLEGVTFNAQYDF